MIITDIFKEWPLYKHPLGFTLVKIHVEKYGCEWDSTEFYNNPPEIQKHGISMMLIYGSLIVDPIGTDFKTLYPDKDLALLTKWQVSREKLLNIMTARLLAEKGQSYKILGNIHSAENDCKDAVLLHMLPALLPCTVIRRKGKDAWKPTISESQDGFVLHVKTPGDIKIQLDEKTRKINELGFTVQPFVILQGDSLLAIQQSYVSVNEQLYRVENPLSAVDVCFKTFQVLNLSYPIEALNCWTFLQRHFYDITINCDKVSCNVSSLMSDF